MGGNIKKRPMKDSVQLAKVIDLNEFQIELRPRL